MNFLKTYRWLLPLLIFTNVLLACRMVHTTSWVFVFIPWNLFLAIVPLYFSHMLARYSRRRVAWGFLALWLLFFPNAMYIVTDLFHLKQRSGIPQWYDLLILFTAALNGLIIGFLSLKNVEQFLCIKMHRRYIPVVLFGLFLLCGYGIYLGRYLRWNSWDIATDPLELFDDIKQNVVHPFRNIQCWMLTGLFGTWLFIMYNYFKQLRRSTLLQPGRQGELQ